jgi:lysophospholipase L1-like esterase
MAIDCLILGDSIAKGLSQIRKECVSYAQSGINSHDFNRRYYDRPKSAKTVVVSLGSNDYKGIRTFEELDYLRHAIDSDRVLWILPFSKPDVREAVMRVADNFGDDVLEIEDVSPDRVHPTPKGYKGLAKKTR